jgi:AbrB family looped-hinge helix DNA binding protein
MTNRTRRCPFSVVKTIRASERVARSCPAGKTDPWYTADILNRQYFRKEDTMDATIQVRQRGSVTLPANLREKYGIREGDTFRVIDLDGIFVLTPMVSMVPELAREIERVRVEAGLSIEELLQTLREEREKYRAEPEAPAA